MTALLCKVDISFHPTIAPQRFQTLARTGSRVAAGQGSSPAISVRIKNNNVRLKNNNVRIKNNNVRIKNNNVRIKKTNVR